MAGKCADVVCFRLPRLYEVRLSVATVPQTETPAIPPVTVVAPDLATVGFVEFPTGSLAAKSVSLDLTNGMSQSYSVKNSSAAFGVLQVATSALLVETAVADINREASGPDRDVLR